MTEHPSKSSHAQLDPLSESHGSARPYVIGFILSLIFTFIPYFLVSQGVKLNVSLLFVILAFAVVQMCIQGVFFLHVGRGPTPVYNLFFLISTLGIVFIVVVASVWIIDNLKYNMSPEDTTAYIIQDEGIASLNDKSTEICQIVPNHREFEVIGVQTYPSSVQASRCDSLTIYNKDTTARSFILRKLGETGLKSNYNVINVRAGGNQSISLYKTGDYELVAKDSGIASAQIIITPQESSDATNN